MSTLSKFGVPTEGQSGGDSAGLLQPKLNYRFRVTVQNFGGSASSTASGDLKEFTRQVMNVTRPKVSHESIPIDSYNSRAYIMGKHTWEPVTITLRDDITNSLTKLVGNQLQKQLNHKNQRGADAGSNYKFTTLIEILDGQTGTAIEEIQLEGCFLQNVDYSQTDYSVSDPVQIILTVQYDNAVFLDNEIMPAEVTFSNNGNGIA